MRKADKLSLFVFFLYTTFTLGITYYYIQNVILKMWLLIMGIIILILDYMIIKGDFK